MTFTINDFEGPLDLLLHLVKANKMDIYNIDITMITKEYLNFVNKHTDLGLDSYSEYLVMASELIHLKSKLLLNKEDDEEDSFELNAPEDLARRLLEYQKIKEVTEDFKLLEQKRGEVYTKLPSSLNEYFDNDKEINTDVGLSDLLNAFELFLKRQKLSEPVNTKVTKKELSVEERSIYIKDKLRKHQGKIKFLELFEDISKPYVIITFLSILTMAKNKEIQITQENNFTDIFIESK